MTEDSRALLILGRWLLLLTLILAVATAWLNNPKADGFYALGRANSLLRDGRYSPAMALLEETLKTYQGPQIRLSLSFAYLARRDEVRAERQVRIALPTASPPLRPLLLAQLGRVLRFAGRGDEALAAFASAEEEAASYPAADPVREAVRSAHWHEAMIYWARGDWTAARDRLERLTSGSDRYAMASRVRLAQLLAPTDSAATSRLAVEARQLLAKPEATLSIPNMRVPGLSEGLSNGEAERSLTTLDAARLEVSSLTQLGSDQVSIWVLWGGAYLQMGEPLLARQYLEMALVSQPDSASAHARLGLALFTLGDAETALEHVETAVTLDTDDPLPRHILARIYTALGDWDEAEAQLQALNRLQPDGVETHLEWAQFYRLQGEYDLAEGEYIDAVNAQITASVLPPGSLLGGVEEETNAGLLLARFYTDIRGFGCEKGLPAARQAVVLRPDDPAGFDAVGWALVICNRPADALSTLEEAVRRSPDQPRYHFHLARAYRDLERYADAREQYNITMDLDPKGSWEYLALTDLVAFPPDAEQP